MISYYKKDDMGVIEFNDPDSEVNLLSKENFKQLESIIDSVTSNKVELRALFFTSKKQNVFIAGADIKELAAMRTEKEVVSFCKNGQRLFSKIADLKMPTFTIVDGACVGGGMELALSCDHILATTNKRVKIGLPEVKLGISPGFGGPHRLKEKIGSKRADSLMDKGELIFAKEAKELGIIDKIIPESRKCDYEKLARLPVQPRRLDLNPTYAVGQVEAVERQEVIDKIFQPPAQNALSSYLLVDKYKGPELLSPRLKRCSVIGAGTMGRDIAYLISLKTELPVDITDANKNVLKKARPYIKNICKDAISRGMRPSIKNIRFGNGVCKDTDIVIESIIEDALKKKILFSQIEKSLRKDCIIATNTSCISIEELSRSLRNAERFIGMHFFNPAYKMKLVEVIPTRFTSKEVLSSTIGFLRSFKKIPLVVKDSPGFLVNRMILPYLNEALFMLKNGFNAEDIENAMLDFGMPVGPLRLLEEIGHDVAYKASEILEQGLGDKIKTQQSSGRKDIANRLLCPIRRQAELCLKEGIVGSREDIDLALLLGVGFPRSRRIWEA
ncbi:MAG: 3-hydroxyacyl-CoA dehydrogenase NAD-binding domain-containing protein [Candidatus Gorgyraea atricola]|nr:3-hydroxyacyl-CoA dehydrogenase NAD-binding domain-containing protein [Candidatus Gorgyraea atricola]